MTKRSRSRRARSGFASSSCPHPGGRRWRRARSASGSRAKPPDVAAYTGEVARRRAVCLVAILAALSGGIASPAGGAQALPTVALGDSVPRGTNCHCTPYPQLIADQLSKTSGETVTAANDSVAGYTTANVLRQVTSDRSVIQHLRSAGAIEIEIGANDVPYTSACGTTVSCYAARVPVMKTRLTAIVRRIRAVTSRHRADVVLLDYWSIWLGGEYAAAKGPKYVAAAEEMTARVNAA